MKACDEIVCFHDLGHCSHDLVVQTAQLIAALLRLLSRPEAYLPFHKAAGEL